MSWLQVQGVNPPLPFGLRHYWKGHLVRETPAALADAVLEAAAEIAGRSVVLVELIHEGGPSRSCRLGGIRRARGSRQRHGARVLGRPAADEQQVDWARRAATRFERFSLRGGGYRNYRELDQSASRVAAAFGPESFERLRRLKRLHDPANRFRFNANILPADS
jgi:Berberine and berberine like